MGVVNGGVVVFKRQHPCNYTCIVILLHYTPLLNST